MFADDTKVGQDVSKIEGSEELQNTLNRLWKWVNDWGMAFNVDKCHVMHFGRSNIKNKYKMDGRELEKTTTEKDVGVLISNHAKPSAHVKKAASTATAVLNQILCTFHYRDRKIYLRLYAQYVRPHLKFAAPAWSPRTITDKECIESMQKKAIKAVSGLKGKTYEEKLRELEIQSLEQRRDQADLVQVYKIVHGIDNVDKGQWFEILDGEGVTRGQQGRLKLKQKRSRLDLRSNFFSQRVIPMWNNLPEELSVKVTVRPWEQLLQSKSDTHVEQLARRAESLLEPKNVQEHPTGTLEYQRCQPTERGWCWSARKRRTEEDVLTRGLPGSTRTPPQVYQVIIPVLGRIRGGRGAK